MSIEALERALSPAQRLRIEVTRRRSLERAVTHFLAGNPGGTWDERAEREKLRAFLKRD